MKYCIAKITAKGTQVLSDGGYYTSHFERAQIFRKLETAKKTLLREKNYDASMRFADDYDPGIPSIYKVGFK